MGSRVSRREVVPQTERARDGLYKYPPSDGSNYFSSHFRLGNRKYESGKPEYFLFGDVSEVNFLNKKPVQFPYKQPDGQAPLHCLQALINIHRDSVRLVRSTQNEEYFVEFEFNSDVDCRLSLLSSLPDTADLCDLRYSPGTGVTSSQHHLFSKGSEMNFKGRDFPLTPGELREEDLSYDPENGQDTFPFAILMETATGSHYQSQLTLCTVEKSNDNGYTLKVFKQKLLVDGVEYLLHEVYGLENKSKSKETSASSDGEEGEDGEEEEEEDEEDEEDLGAECVVCITDVRDTVLLPCRHLCLCATCAANLRYQSNNCPICRTPFRALLQVTALQPLDPSLPLDEDEITGNPRYDFDGFEKMPLLEALNGYKLKLPSEVEAEEEEEAEEETPPAAEGEEEGGGGGEGAPNGTTATASHTPDTVISVEEDSEIETTSKQPLATPTGSTHPSSPLGGSSHMRIDLEDIPGLVTPPSPEVGYKGGSVGGGSGDGGRVVTVVMEEGRGGGAEEGMSQECTSNTSDSSCMSSPSDDSTQELLHKT